MQERIITDGSGYKPAKIILLHFVGVASNKPANIKILLKTGNINNRVVPQICFDQNNTLEILIFEGYAEKTIIFFKKFKVVKWLSGYSLIRNKYETGIKDLEKGLCSALERKNMALPLKRFTNIIKHFRVTKTDEDALKTH